MPSDEDKAVPYFKGGLLERITTLLSPRTALTIIPGPAARGQSTLLRHVLETMTDQEREDAYRKAIDDAIRSDPGVPLIGEIRDPDGILKEVSDETR